MRTDLLDVGGSFGAWLRKVSNTLLDRRVALVLVVVSIADVATTALALSWGAPELSPGGAAALAAVGVAGLVGLKLVALGVVWLLNREWPTVGRGVSGGLTLITTAAVTWNVFALGSASARLAG